MDDRVLTTNALLHGLDPLALAPDDVLTGSPRASITELDQVGGIGVGIWQLTAGTVRDIETDEVFVVLAGRATLTFEGESPIELTPGVVVRLRAGDRTTWEVHETLRKVYIG